MDELLEQESEEILTASPVAGASKKPKSFITKQRVSIEPEIPEPAPVPSTTPNPDAGKTINTIKDSEGNVTQHINDKYPDSANLVDKGGDAYIGGTVSPNSSVRAKIRPMTQYTNDPFWLESTDRFTPVGPWKAELSILNKPVTLDTTDVAKGAWQIAQKYAGVPDEDFFGYEYLPQRDIKESWWSSFWSDYETSMANIIANSKSAVKGLLPTEEGKAEAAKTPEQRAQENRDDTSWAGRWLLGRAQSYLDYINQLEPLDRGRGAEITGAAGTMLASYLPVLALAPAGGVGALAGRAASIGLSTVDTLSTRDRVLELGGTVEDAQKAGWEHLGFIGGMEALTGALGRTVSQRLIRGAINRGASKAATAVAGATGATIAGGIDSVGETLQDKFAPIATGEAGVLSMFNWNREDWNTFFGGLLLASLRAPGGAIEAGNISREVETNRQNALNGYLELAAGLKKALYDKSEAAGVRITPEINAKLDSIIMDIWNDPQSIVDDNLRSVSQDLFDRLSTLDPDAVAQARADMELTPEKFKELSPEALAKYDQRVQAEIIEPANRDGTPLTDEEQTLIRGIMRGYAYMRAFFFGDSPAEVRFPDSVIKKRSLDLIRKTGTPGKTSSEYGIDELLPRSSRVELPTENYGVLGFSSPYDSLLHNTLKDTILSNIIHEIGGHFVDSMFGDKRVTEGGRAEGQFSPETFKMFLDWYTEPIYRAAEQGMNADDVYNNLNKSPEEPMRKKLGFAKGTRYTSTKNATEWRAHSLQSLYQDAKNYLGLRGWPAEYIQAAHALMMGLQDVTPVSNAVSEYLDGMREYVRMNSDIIKGIRDKIPAQQLKAALEKYLGGDTQIDWFGIDPSTLEQFMETKDSLLDGDALQYVKDSIPDIIKAGPDVVEEANHNWDSAFLNRPLDQSEQVQNTRQNKIDGDINPETYTDDLLEKGLPEDWEAPTGEEEVITSKSMAEQIDQILDGAADEAKEKVSGFRKAVERKFANKTIVQDIDDFLRMMKEHKFNKTSANVFLFTDYMRGPEAFLNAVGGERLAKRFDFTRRYSNFISEKQKLANNRMAKLLPIFDNSLWKYEDYERKAAVPMYEIDYYNPATRKSEKRVFSKRELMSEVAYDEQPDSTERIHMTVNKEEVRKYLDETDLAVVHVLRDYLNEDYRVIKEGMKGAEKVPVNYFPIMDSYEAEKGSTKIINDYGRHNIGDPIGLVDVFEVVNSYESGVAATRSGYFAAMRRLNSILNYNQREASTPGMTPEDDALNADLDRKSTQISQEIRKRIGDYNYERLVDGVRDVIGHRTDDVLRNGLAGKIARTSIATLLYGNLKQFAVNVTPLFTFMGYRYTTIPKFIKGVFKAIADPKRTAKLIRENPGLESRHQGRKYSEYIEKNFTTNSDNMLTYLSNFATKQDATWLEKISDFGIHFGMILKNILGAPMIYGDRITNAVGYAAIYDDAVKAFGNEEAARQDIMRFIDQRQSTANQAVKGLMVRRANRAGPFGNLFAFTGESTQTMATIGRDINGMITGDVPIKAGVRDITGQALKTLSYVAVQSGLILAGLAAVFGGRKTEPDDKEWEKVFENIYRELLLQSASVLGPLANIGGNILDRLVYDRPTQGLSIPMMSLIETEIEHIRKGEYSDFLYLTLSLAGIATGLPRAVNSIRGVARGASSKSSEQRAAKYQALGHSEKFADRMAGVKKKKK